MKKLLLVLLALPLIGFGQACQYGSSADASELCDFYQTRSFATYKNADIALDKILSVTGMSKRFVLKECNDISNCLATTYKGIRYILYDREFMDAIATRTNSWSSTSILAHEIGHHVNGHTLEGEGTLAESRQMELEADEYSGFVMYKLGASLSQAQEAIALFTDNKDDSYSTHPSKDKRLRAIEKGYNNAKSQGSNTNTSTKTSTLTAEDYFYLAYNNESDYQYKIENYTKCLKLEIDDANKATAYYNRGIAYYDLENYKAAIADYTSALRIDPGYAAAYNNRGIAYRKLENYKAAIADYTSALKINPDDADAYYNRGNAYYNLENYTAAIADYTSALRINPGYAAAYNGRGNAYTNIGNYNEAIADFKSALRINPDYAGAYNNRGYAYEKLKNYTAAIADYTSALRINPDFAYAYNNRGTAKKNVGLSYCSDFKKSCELGHQLACDNYNTYCK
jgi:tetratricopeptide (TPR) repeat protein